MYDQRSMNHLTLIFRTLSLMTLATLSLLVQASEIKEIRTPIYTHVTSFGTEINSNEDKSRHTISSIITYPITLEFKGPLGGIVRKKFMNQSELELFTLEADIIRDKNSHPETVDVLPSICPRVILQHNRVPRYLGQFDRINHIPTAQLLDPDVKNGQQYKAYTEIDGKNVLLLRHVKITNDYEDSSILDYSGPNPITGVHQDIYEGEGGFYANIHYAIIPYIKGIDKLGRQEILHLAQGKLLEINRQELTPTLRTHSFIPGPFLSKSGTFYDMCEWGDTAYQAKMQEMTYQNIALWDWDYSIPHADHVWLIVWEGDEEEWMVKEQLLSPFTLTDDIIGVFEIKRKKTLKPLTLKNTAGDFQITIQTGDMDLIKK